MINGQDKEKLQKLIAYMESTTDDQWLTERVSSPDNKKLCCLGHVFFMGGKDQEKCNEWWNWFENSVATEYMIFPVNDGRDKDFPQLTPKLRVIAYLQEVMDGKRKTTWELMDECHAEWSKRNEVA